MKKGSKITALLLAMVAAGTMTAGLVACGGNEDPDEEKQQQTTEAEKLKDGGAIVLTDGRATVDLTQYVNANGNEYRVSSSNPNVATAAISGNTLTVTEVGTGSAIITVSCGNVQLTFSVTVAAQFYTVTLDGVAVPSEAGEKWAAGSVYTLPAEKESDDPNLEFKGWSVNGETKQAEEVLTVDENLTITAIFERKAAVEVIGHAQSVSLNEGKTATVTIADYITAYGREVTASAAETDIVAASVEDGVVTLTGVAQGTATLTLSTEGVTVTIEVNVLSVDMPTFENTTLEVDLFTQDSNSLEFVPNEPSGEHTYTYEYSLRTQDAKASIANGALTYEPGADYDIEEDGATVAIVVDAAVTIDGNASGTVSFTVTVHIKDTAPAAPTFENVTETINPFSDTGYMLTLKAEDENFTYVYEIDESPVTGNKVYTTEAEETVYVTYTYKGNTAKHGTASFTVNVSYDRSYFPTLKEESVTTNVDLAEVEGGVYTVPLFENFTNTDNISGYTVNDTEHTDGTEYTISNSENTYGETETTVTYTVVATFVNNLGSLEYTYTVNVCDSTAFRMENGGFEDETTGWTGATGVLSSAATYWDIYSMNNEGQYYDGTRADTETITSPSFIVGGSGWITFKFGSARPIEGSNLRNVHLEFYKVGTEGDTLIADVRNILFEDPAAALKLNDYKLDLSDYRNETVYVKAIDGESGNGDFRFIILDAFVTYWKEAPTDEKYADLTATRYFNPTAQIDLKDGNTVTLNPVLSQGLVASSALTATVDQEGLSVDTENPLLLTATKSGNYTVTYALEDETVFTANVTVTNTVEIPAFADMALSVKTGESGTLTLPLPEADSRFTYAYTGDGVDGNVLTYDATEAAEGTYSVEVSVTVTDTRWCEQGDTFTKAFTVTVTVFGDKILEGELLTEGQAELSLDAYAIKQETPEATSAQIDFSRYLIVPEGVNAVYTVTRKIGEAEATSVLAEGGAYALPFDDCGLSTEAVVVVFTVTAANEEDETDTVTFTLTVSIKDTTDNRVVNGGFETGDLTGWTLEYTDGSEAWEGNPVQNNDGYWSGTAVYNKEGVYHFNGQEDGIPEGRTFELTSSEFILGGSGFISFKLGGHAAVLKVYVMEDGVGTQVAQYENTAYADHDISHVHWGAMQATMTTYVADLSEYVGKIMKIVLCDDMTCDWGHSILDDVVTYYETAPTVEGRFDTVNNLCGCGGTTDIPWRKAENSYSAG